MKVLHINCNYMTTVLHQTMIEHLDHYTENVVVCPFQIGRTASIIPNDNVKVLRCFRKSDRILFFLKQSKILKAIYKSIIPYDYDLLHAYTLMTDGNIAYSIYKTYGIPYVVAIRDTDLYVFFKQKPYLIPLGIKIMENAQRVFFLSESHKQEMVDNYIPKQKKQLIENKIEVIPNGIDDYWFDNLYIKHNSENEIKMSKNIKCVCVGQISKRKNIPTVQSAIRILNSEDWNAELHVIGKVIDSNEFNKIDQSFTKYHPPVNKSKLIDYYRNADVFVLASLTETFGLVYAEALSQGLPVIYTKSQGFDGQFEEGIVGYSVKATDPYDIAQKIKMVINNYDSIARNTVNCVHKFDWNRIVYTYYKLYTEILGK